MKKKMTVRGISAFLSVLVVISSFIFVPANADGQTVAEPLKLLCIGDSITHGSGWADEVDPNTGKVTTHYHTSYRYALWKKFIDNGYNIEFVGDRDKNFKENCKEVGSEYKGQIFNNKHEAHYGITLYDLLNGYIPTSANENTLDANGVPQEPVATVPPLKEHLKDYDVDVVIMFMGTNTRMNEDGSVYETDAVKLEEMKQLIAILRERNPKVVIYMMQVYTQDTYSTLNAGYQEIADTMSTEDSPIICMRSRNPRWKMTKYTLSFITDGIHPDAAGEDYLSEIILNSMRPFLNGEKDIKNIPEPFEIFPVEDPVKPTKPKLTTKKITPKTKVIKGRTNVGNADVIIKAGKKTIVEDETNKKGVFSAKVNLKKIKPGKKLSIQIVRYYEAYDYTDIIKKSPVLTVKVKKAK